MPSYRRSYLGLLGILLTASSGLLHAGENQVEGKSATTPVTMEPLASAVVPDTIEARVAACAACHGKHGEGIRKNEYFPRLAGKPADYLYNQLQNFRAGRRTAPQMVYMVKYLSDSYLKEIAQYYAAMNPPYPPPLNPAPSPAALTRGEALANKGDQAKQIPACTSCHGTALTGMQPAIPGVVGLYSDYIAQQLSAWRSGQRKSKSPDCMALIASRLEPTDIAAVAGWLAFQTAPQHAQPAAPSKQKLPLDCGSVAQSN